ncbi:MAG: hypothetical protein HY397_01110 [Candidatus Doudnabacteria bacterium]|nr:hypothetical protein [Candidatus Doudnabacteria bacterium]
MSFHRKKAIRSRNNNQAGIATIEILIAFVVVILSITAVVGVVFGSQSMGLDALIYQEAQLKAQDLLEDTRATARQAFSLVNPRSFAQDIYQVNLDVQTLPDFFTKKIVSRVTWLGEGNRNLNVQLASLVTNLDDLDGGDTCNSELLGDWQNPQMVSYEFGRDILNDTSSGFPVTSIQAFQHKLYVTVNNDNGNNPGTFYILDISDPTIMPVLLTPPLWDNSPVGAGLNAVAVDNGNYAYVANGYGASFSTCPQSVTCNQMQVIDISVNPPVVVKSYKVPGVTGSAGQGIGKSIFYKNGIVYLGLAKAGGATGEFVVLDVGGGGAGGSPTNPILRGSYEIDNGVNAIQVRGNYAYIASPNNEELKILDISDPTDPVRVGGFDAPLGGGNNGNGKSLYLVGDTLYLGRTLLNGDEFWVLNNTDPETTLPALGSKNIQNSGSNTSVNGMIIRDFLAFLITNESFQTWRIDNPSAISQYANPLILPPGTGGGLQGTATDCEGNYIFVGSQSSNDKGYISVITGGP